MNITTEWIQKALQKRANRLEKHLSNEFRAQLDSLVEKKILGCKARADTHLREQEDNSLRSFFTYFMKKQSAIMIGVGTVAVLAVLVISTQNRRVRTAQPVPNEIDILLASVSTDPQEIEQALSDMDGLDESLDQELVFDEDSTGEGRIQPPSQKSAPTPDTSAKNPTNNKAGIKVPSVDISSLDALLGDMDQLKASSDTSFSDLDGIDEKEDSIITL